MGAPESGMQGAEQPAAETLLTAFKTIDAAERRRHASVLNYWLSIRGDKEFPPLHDLDPLEISDAGPSSVLLELISGGHDADIRHLGDQLKTGEAIERIMDAPNPSILHSIARKLPIVAISRDFLAFEDEYSDEDGATRCWVTLLPLSAGGAWVDYVYAVVSVETESAGTAEAEETHSREEAADAAADELPVADEESETATAAAEKPPETPPAGNEQVPEEPASTEEATAGPGFAKLFDSIAGLAGFYGQSVKAEAVHTIPDPAGDEIPPVAEESAAEAESEAHPTEDAVSDNVAEDETDDEQAVAGETAIEEAVDQQPAEDLTEHPTPATEGHLQSKLTEVRAKADEARSAKLRANAALYEGLGAAYDFAIDAEDSPEEYLSLVQAQGMKIQLRSPMTPVVKLAFDGLCDDSTIGQLEAVLAWALEQNLPRGALPARIEEAGGIARILSGESPPA